MWLDGMYWNGFIHKMQFCVKMLHLTHFLAGFVAQCNGQHPSLKKRDPKDLSSYFTR